MRSSVPKLCARRCSLRVLLLAGCLSLTGCYYLQAARGQLALTAAREPIRALIAAEDTPAALRERLALVEAARGFAHAELLLPDNGSYRDYVDLSRDYVVVNVFAAPPLSLAAKRWCYPFIGCLAYRGYFDARRAEAYAARLARRGYDVTTEKVPAYSTLGRLRDPVLNTMLARSDEGIVSLLFHELAHQVLYVDDDTAFNESFASFVAAEGLRRWRLSRGEAVPAAGTRGPDSGYQQRRALIATLRGELDALYASDAEARQKLQQKAALFDALAQAWRDSGARSPAPANNAALLPFTLYSDLTPAFARLLQQCADDLACFYDRVTALAALDATARHDAVQLLIGA